MNKADLVDAVAASLGESKTAAAKAVDAVLSEIARGVRERERVTLAGFGAFERKVRAARRGVNPVTKERMLIEPSVTMAFRASQGLRDTMGPPDGHPNGRA